LKPDPTHWYIIINPTAGKGFVKKHLAQIFSTLDSRNLQYQWVETQKKNHATELTKLGIEKGFRKIMAIGGDGTNNEVVNGILSQNHISSVQITYCLFPVGTGNDWIKEHQIPKDLNTWIKMVLKGQTFLQDIGLVKYIKDGKQEQRYFVNVAGMSYDPFVLEEMEKLKRPITNRLAYLAYGMYYVFKYKIPKARVHFNKQVVEGFYYLINVGICKYSGGGMQLVPHAIPDDGKLALTLAGKLTKLGVILNSYRFYNGTVLGHPKVDGFQTDYIKVEGISAPVLVEVDGEVLGTTPVEFSILKKVLKIIRP